MKPLLVLLGTFVLSLLAIQLLKGEVHSALAARIAMSVMLLFTAVGHFVFVRGMTMMMPDFVPFKKEIVYATGILEVAAALGLLIPRLQHMTAWGLILFFLLILPANISAALRKVDYQKATNDGPNIGHLWFRIPLQFVFIAWVYFCAAR